MRGYKPSVKLSTISTESFGCCSSWDVCEMGKKSCVYEKDDIDYAKLCACYRRNIDYRKQDSSIVQTKDDEQEVSVVVTFDESGQGHLF